MSGVERFGIGVVGLGMAAAPHLASLHDLDERIDVRGVYCRDPARRAALAERHNFKDLDSPAELAQDPGTDAVLLLTPPNARVELVEAFAAAGKHVLMEKPVERTTVAAEHIVQVCEAHGVTLGIVFQHRFRAGAQRLRELLASGTAGALACAQLCVPWWRPQAYYDEPGRGTFERDGGGVLISQAIHPLDLMLSLTGEVREVQAIAGTSRLHAMESEDFVAAGLRFASGALGSLVASTAGFPGRAEYLALDCEHASLRLESGSLDVHWHDGRRETFGEPEATGAGADPMAFPHTWHRAVIEDFVAAVRKGVAPAVSGREALRVHRLIDALLASSAQRRVVSVEASS